MVSSNSFDVLVIGSGAAGLYAALCLPQHWQVGLVTKDNIETGSSNWAQGGIAAAINPTDSPQFHLKDTLKAGGGLCDAEAVNFLVEQASDSIVSLLKMGVGFDRQGDRLATTLEAAHSHSRVLHSADTTGRAIVDTLVEQVLNRDNIHVLAQAFTLGLWLHPQTSHCQGISLLHHNQIQWLRAGAVVLATGGGGQVFAQTTNPTVSTGDGVAMAWRAGATLRDLEFFQFHPTALNLPGAPRFLISEAVRGEGAHLVDKQGDRFAFSYHPDGELAPRDIVSRTIFSHLQSQTAKEQTEQDQAAKAETAEADHVYLDLSPITPERIRYRFPKIIEVCQQWGVDVFQAPIPVAPAAHYWMGGIQVDLMGQTSVPGLYAVGETASTGVHGANRLASNSLLECIVFASQLAKIKLEKPELEQRSTAEKFSEQLLETLAPDTLQWNNNLQRIATIRSDLPQLMWQHAGVYRQALGLQQAIDQVQAWHAEVSALDISRYVLLLVPNQAVTFDRPQAQQDLQQVAETLNLLDIACLILRGAMMRTESRGGHHRVDYPETSEDWRAHTLVQGDQMWQDVVQVPVPASNSSVKGCKESI
ncbi:MAG: L-aspartate oxidase [Cyanobacteria bacterium P01_D01_bin.105]